MSSRQRGGAGKRIVKSVVEIGSGVLNLSELIVRPKLSLTAENLFLRKQWPSMKSEECGRDG
jgi:hypothetical protein